MKRSKWTGCAECQFPELQSLALARTSSRGMSQTQAQLGREGREAHAFFAGPQSVMRVPQSQPVEQQTNDQDRLKRREARGGKNVPRYCSHRVASRNLTALPGGRSASRTPHRRNSRQSNSGSASFCGGVLISPGEAPARIRAATRPSSGSVCGREQRPSNNAGAQLIVVLSEYRRVGYGVQPGQNLLLSVRDPLRVDDQVSEQIADRGGSAATRASMSAKESSLRKIKSTRFWNCSAT